MKTITFYSYKGGVGRSLALANVASRLAEFGRQVCLLDFDLEAPGLHYKFSSSLINRGIEINKGIVDYIHQFSNNGILTDSLNEFAYSFLSSSTSYTTLIPAGNANSSDYWKKLSSIKWYDFLYENESGLSFFLDLKEKIRKQIAPEFLLIDSRTGISEMSGIALSLLADEVVVIAANNRENLEGAKKIIKSISNPDNRIVGITPKVTFVLSRIPFTRESGDRLKEQNLIAEIKREFGSLIDEVKVIHSDRDLEEIEQIKIGYDKDESVAQISRDYLDLFEALTINDLSEKEIADFKTIKDSERQFQKAASETDPENKLKYIDKAIELNKSNIDFILYRASIYEKRSDWKKVIDNCDLVLQSDTSNLLAYEMKGNAQLKLKEYGNAKNTFERVLESNENRVSAKLGLARIATNEKEYDKALSYYDELVEKDVQNAVAYNERANIKRLTHNYLSALEDIYRALELNLDYASAFLTLAKINTQLDNKHEFYLNLEKALKLDPKIIETDIDIHDENTYKHFLNDQRFLKILERYDIHIENDDKQKD